MPRAASKARSSSSTPPRSRRSAWKSRCSASKGRTASSSASLGALEEGPWRHALHRRNRRHAARDPEQRSCACWSIRPSSAPVAPPRSMSTCASSRRPRAISRRRSRQAISRGPLSSPVGGADPRSAAVGASRRHSRVDRLLHGPDISRDPGCRSASRPGRHGGTAVACLAGATSGSFAIIASG